jgi:phospholipid/cholesterol/gamma-HCH transport system ATP-binding protein
MEQLNLREVSSGEGREIGTKGADDASGRVRSTRAPIIRFSHVEKAFGAKIVLRALDLDVFEGETLTVMGASGCGKSVLLKLLIRLLELDAGSITFHGEEVSTMNNARISYVRQRIAMLFQGAALFDSISVGENVAYGLHEHFRNKLSDAEIAQRVSWALSLVGLPGIEEMRPSDLSGGMKKRAALARALAVKPDVILYDEPTGGLDPINTERVNHLIRGLKNALHVTSIVVTHDMKSAFSISDRIAMLYRGEIIAIGTPDEIRASTDPRVNDFVRGFAPTNEDVETLLHA